MTKKIADTVAVYPVPGHFLQGVPAAPLAVAADVAERLVRTGAFTFDAPPGAAEPVVFEPPDLDHYDPAAAGEEN